MKTDTEFTKQLEEAIRSSFPESHVSVYMRQITGNPFCYVSFALGKDNSEYSHGYIENDNIYTRIMINGFDSECKATDKLKVESMHTKFYVKPTGKLYAYDSIKTGWRNFTAKNEQDVVKKIGRYFDCLKKLMVENFDKMTDDAQKLMVQKQYIKK